MATEKNFTGYGFIKLDMETNYTKVQSSWQQLELKQVILSICSGMIAVNILPERKGYTQENLETLLKQIGQTKLWPLCSHRKYKDIFATSIISFHCDCTGSLYCILNNVSWCPDDARNQNIHIHCIDINIRFHKKGCVYFFTLFYCGYFCFWNSVSVMIHVPKTVQISNTTCKS